MKERDKMPRKKQIEPVMNEPKKVSKLKTNEKTEKKPVSKVISESVSSSEKKAPAKRGRPKKVVQEGTMDKPNTDSSKINTQKTIVSIEPQKKRGRPKKSETEIASQKLEEMLKETISPIVAPVLADEEKKITTVKHKGRPKKEEIKEETSEIKPISETEEVKTVEGSTFEEETIVTREEPKEVKTITFTVDSAKKEKRPKRRFSNLETTVLMLIIAALGIAIGYSLATRREKNNGNYTVVDPEMQTFLENYNYILENYYGNINKKDLINAALSGMLGSLDDPYSEFLEQENSNTFQVTLAGEYEGLGIEIINDENHNIYVSKVLDNSSASKNGVQVLDRVKSINGKSLEKTKTSEFVKIVKESTDKIFTIVVDRKGEEKTFSLEKTKIVLQSVKSKIIEENGKKIGYLEVSIFASNTAQQFEKALLELEKQGIQSLMIDLRDNSGGHLSAVDSMLSLFLDKTKVIYQTEGKSGTVKTYSKGTMTKTYPIVILTNENSASASEVMTAALKEQLNATIVGKKTYGKGTVQELQTLPNGDQYKFTTKKWLTPKGNWINEVGIVPDIEITLDKVYYENPIEENDNQYQEALKIIREK